ncbi:MAG TPA: hypothetical protein VN871_06175 [Mycobacterium sp.]|nr:hypothetical protein [Mycobacterium sp.]
MAYRVTAQVNVDWVGPGTGPMSLNLGPALPQGGRGGAQTKEFSNKQGGYNSLTFTGSDITALTNAIAADMVTQFTAAQAQIQAFATGNP